MVKVSIALVNAPNKFLPLTEISIKSTGGAVLSRHLPAEAAVPGNAAVQASGVVAVRFDFSDGEAGYNLYREISLVGQATR